jgi:penicillin amidase
MAFNRGPFPFGGDGNTLSQAGTAPIKVPSNPGVVASLRMTVDVGDWDRACFVLPGGQSGNPFSPHYDDQLPLWLRGEGVPIAWTAGALAAATRETLYLSPLPGGQSAAPRAESAKRP